MKFDIFIRRAFEALKISSQNRLAILLGINSAGITQAKNKGTVPDKWILDLYRKYGINPDWIETGKGIEKHPGKLVLKYRGVKSSLLLTLINFEQGSTVDLTLMLRVSLTC